ncbi:methyl-accepting chemotaxis protein [Bacillus alkalicellulosilyticus]|uniref:methyl-accepting chemotaxis protein n=1 Tax=Alkalihalobacterium alkalicellulosilyticum TaxID=1912214 RepID=UPI0009966580|nr:methyl-accepting chemotaxis protein [Bacillus alkalicellulosilyticus]
MKIGVKGKLTLLFVILFSLMASIISGYSISIVKKDIFIVANNSLQDGLSVSKGLIDYKMPGEWSVQHGKLYKGTTEMNDNFAIVDELSRLTNNAITIFQGDTRVTTSVLLETGERAVGTQVSEQVAKHTLEGGQVFTGEAEVVGQRLVTIYEPITNAAGETIGMLFIGQSAAPYYDMISEFQTTVILFGASALIIIALLVFFMIKRGVKPLEEITNIAREIADGNLKVGEITVRSKDEIGQLSQSINQMTNNLKGLIAEVMSTAEQTAATAEELAASADVTGDMSAQIAKTTNDLAGASEKQSNEAGVILTKVDIAISKVTEGDEVALRTLQRAQMSSTEAEEGNIAINDAIQHLDKVTETIEFATDSIQKLNRRSSEIGGIITVITDIANQTNLLALNAAIEAARAGEHGKGFAVVASEVRQLAEQSNNAANQITSLIGDIQSETTVTVNTMETNLESINQQVNMIQKGGDSLYKIVGNVKETEEGVEVIKQILSEIRNNASDVMSSVKQISETIEIAVAATEEAAASSEEQSATVQEVAGSANELAKIAEKLQNELKIFKL